MNIRVLIIALVSTMTLVQTAAASLTDEANEQYAAGQYAEAEALYRQVLETEPSADIYYNMGNACFKQGELAQSILAYERALRIDPGHEDARHNLEFARTRIVDNIRESGSFFLADWMRKIRNSLSVMTWLWSSIVLFWLMLIGILAFLLSKNMLWRKVGFFGGILTLLLTLYTGANAWTLNSRNTSRNEAIITRGIVNVKSSPGTAGTDLFTLHEGTKITITETVSGWANIHVGQHDGWILLEHLERI